MSPFDSGVWALCVLSLIVCVLGTISICTYVCSARSRRGGYCDIDGEAIEGS
jgi:hypothetical protein